RVPLQGEPEGLEGVEIAPDAVAAAERLVRHERALGPAELVQQGDVQVHGGSDRSKSRPMSSDRAEWVRAPTLIRSTPVFARIATDANVIPPEASSWTPGAFASRRRTASATSS